jgi:acetyltransferase-like isoleucine patch superfamily enzyme
MRFLNYIGVKSKGRVRFISLTSSTFGSEPYLVELGNKVTITKNVQFLTHDGSMDLFREKEPDIELFGRIVIGNNVFIGYGCILLPNTVVGDNVIIGAGSVVRGELESNYVYAGVPVKKICTLNEFYTKNKANYTYIRNLPTQEKKEYLEKIHFKK